MTEDCETIPRPQIAQAKRIVVKVGTRVLTHTDGRLALVRLFQIVESLATLRRQGRDVILVSSGAMGLGRDAMGLDSTPTELVERQACSAIGQSRIMRLYDEGFGRLGVVCAQVLLTQADFEDRSRYLTLRGCMKRLLDHGVIPVVNENDVVSSAELRVMEYEGSRSFGDNDRLSALVAQKLGCDLLVLVTDVCGVYDKNPHCFEDARLIRSIEDQGGFDADIRGPDSHVSRGGMLTKVEAGLIASRSGCHAVITSGFVAGSLDRVLAGEDEGTWFPARGGLPARKRWIAFATRPRGSIQIDDGAVRALVDRGASLLAAGVIEVTGCFVAGDVVELRGPQGEPVGRGIVRIDAQQLQTLLQGGNADRVRREALIRRNHMVLEEALR